VAALYLNVEVAQAFVKLPFLKTPIAGRRASASRSQHLT
jgi:hypothetical protein